MTKPQPKVWRKCKLSSNKTISVGNSTCYECKHEGVCPNMEEDSTETCMISVIGEPLLTEVSKLDEKKFCKMTAEDWKVYEKKKKAAEKDGLVFEPRHIIPDRMITDVCLDEYFGVPRADLIREGKILEKIIKLAMSPGPSFAHSEIVELILTNTKNKDLIISNMIHLLLTVMERDFRNSMRGSRHTCGMGDMEDIESATGIKFPAYDGRDVA